MLNKIAENQAEQIAVNPSQAAFSLTNNSKFPTPLDALSSTTDTNITNSAINHALTNNPDWQTYLSDPLRFEKPENKKYFSVESLMDDARYYSIADKYGNELADRAQILIDYAEPDDWWMRQRMGVNAAIYGAREDSARKALSNAILSGDEEKIALAKAELQKEEFNVANNSKPYNSEFANTVAQIGASLARNPETFLIALGAAIATGGIGGAVAAGTLGATAGALATAGVGTTAALGTAGIVFDDTYKVESGGALKMLDEEFPELTEAQKADIANQVGVINGLIESIPTALSGGVLGRGMSALRRASTKAALRKAVAKEVLESPTFLKAFKKDLEKKTLKGFALDTLADANIEAATEVIQNSMTEAAKQVAYNPDASVLAVGAEDLADFIANPLDPKHADKLSTYVNVALASPLFSGAFGGVTYAVDKTGSGRLGNKMSGVQKNQKVADGLFQWRNQSEVAKASPETAREHLQRMVDKGNAPSTVYLDKQSAEELMDTDPDVREAFEKLGVLQAIRESETNGGTVEIPLVEYDEVINGDSSGKLYQKVRAMVSFDNNLLSTAEFMRYIQTDANVQGEIAEAQKKADSVYNKTLEIMNAVENMDENTKKMNATIMQLITNRIAGFSIGSPKTAEEVFSKVDILTGREEATAETLNVKLPTKPLEKVSFNYRNQDFEVVRGEKGSTLRMNIDGENVSSIEVEDGGLVKETYTAPDKQGRGLDEEVVLAAEQLFGPLTITVAKGNKAAEKFWFDKMGYTKLVRGKQRTYTKATDATSTDGPLEAGWFEKQGDRLVINLTKAQNPTTFAHEAFHLFADSLIESYNADALSPYWKAQAEKMFKSAGVKLKDGKAKLTTVQQEKLANQFTTYILEGKVQNKELTPLFAYMKDLFAKVYRLLGMHKYKLDKNITSVFDSIFNSQAEIEAEQRILGMLEFEKPAGADQTLYDRYISFLLNSRSKASQKMVKAIFAYEAFKNSEEYKTRYAKEYADALAVLNDSMAYQIKALAATVNNDPALTFAMFSAQHPDAEITVDAIEEILNNTPEMTVEAERMANEAMNDVVLERFGIDKETFASRALRNADKAKALLAEAMMREGKTWAEFEEEYSKLLRGVENQTARMTLSKIRNMNYWANQEARLVEQYAYYLATGDMKRAAEARRAQAALTLIRMKGEELDKRATRFKADFPDKMRFNQKKDTVSAQAWDLMQSILERYGFKITSKRRDPRPVNVKLEEWVADKEKTYFTTIGNMRYFIPAILEGHTGKFSEMQVRKFEELEHVLKAINSLARDEFRITTEGETTLVRDLVEESIKRLDEKNIMPFEKTNSWWKTHFGVLGSWVNPEPVLEALFPERVTNKVFRPLFTAAAKAENQAQDWSNRWAAIKSKVDLSSNKVRYSNGVELKQYEVADLLLAMGTPHAYENFRLKFNGLTEEQAELVVSEALKAQPALEQFAKDTWALYAETTEVMNKSFMKRFNQLFVKKEHRKFTINGIEFEGGYVPENKGNVTLPENPDYHSIQMAMLGSEKLLVKEADGEVRSIVDNTDSRLYLFARWGYAAAEYNNVCKFLENETLQARLGDRGNRFIYDWLKGYQTPQTDASGMIRPLMTATSMSALGFRLSTALMQLSGFIPASQVVGMRWMVRAIRRNLTEIKMESAITKAANKSAYMKARYGNPISSMFGLEAKDISKTKWVREKYQKYAMVLISYVDAIIANATWDAAYLKATESKGLSREEAILEADAAVRVSQSDSMALSRSKALQSNWARLLTPFSTYIMGMQSLVRGRIAENERLTAATVALGYIVVATLYEAVLKEAVDDIWEDDEDDDKFVERVFQTWYNQALGTFGNTIMPAMSIGGSVVSRLAYGFEEALWDDDGEMVTKVYAPTVSAMNYYSQALSIIQNSIPAVAGDDEAQVKVMLNSIGLLSQRTKKIVKEWMNE